jgi:flagellar hook-length control protein FliK
MSVPIVGPGPLEGGPKSSPGSAKSGESFSSHFKHACDQSETVESSSAPVKPVSEQPEKKETNAKKNGVKKSDAQEGKETSAPGSRGLIKGKDSDTTKASNSVSSDTTKPTNSETNPLISPVGIVVSPVPNAADDGDSLLVEAGTNNESDPILMEEVLPGGSPDSDALIPVFLPEAAQNSDIESSEDLVKSEAKPPEVISPIVAPVLLNLAAVMPTDPLAPINSTPPSLDSNDDSLPVEEALAVKNAVAPVPQELLPSAEMEEKGGALTAPKAADGVLSKERPKPAKEPEGTFPPAEDARDKPVSDRSTLGILSDPTGKALPPDPLNSTTQNQEKDLRRNLPESNEITRPTPLLPPESMSSVTLTTDVATKVKESAAVPPMGPKPIGVSDGATVALGSVVMAATPPVSEARPVEPARPAAPVVTPSPVDLARQIHVHLESGRSVVRIELHPDHMGEVRISMETKGKDVSMQFTVDNDNARHVVVAGMREITGTLSTLGWSVSGLAVNVSSGGVGDGGGNPNDALWGAGQNMSNTLRTEPEAVLPRQRQGEWRVDLVA